MLYSVICCIAYILGILWGLNLQKVGLVPIFIALGCMLVYLIHIYTKENHNDKLKIFKLMILMSIFLLFGFINTSFRYKQFRIKYNTNYIESNGEIIRLLKEGDYYNKYLIKLENKDKSIIYIPNQLKLDLNTVISFKGRYEKPSEARNKGGFNNAIYLYSQNIYGSIYINNIKDIDIVDYRFDLINTIRTSIFNVLGRLFPKEQLGIIYGMIIGDTFYISDDIEESFRISGISHLLAVSGTNITYIIIFTMFLFDKLFGKSFANYISILLIILFVLISGCSPSVLRAGIMAIIFLFSNILSRCNNTYSTISVTALIILIYNPLILCDIGFILSFVGTLGIVSLSPKINSFLKSVFSNKFNTLIDIFSVSLSAQVFLLPIICYYFNTFSLVSLFTNIIVAPFIGLITILGIVIYIVGLISFTFARVLSYPLYIIVSFVIDISKILSQLPFSNILIPTPKLYVIVFYYLMVLIVFNFKRIFGKPLLKCIVYIAVVFNLIVLLIIHIAPNTFTEVNIIDVGQGDSIHIKTKSKKNILIDSGGSEGSDYDVGKNVLVPYLLDNSNGIIDLVFISHFHEDHAEGLIEVIKSLQVKRLVINNDQEDNYLFDEIINLAKSNNVDILYFDFGDMITIDGITFQKLYPDNIEKFENLNNASMIIKMTIDGVSLLFTGDAEIEEEDALLKTYSDKLNTLDVDILKIGHHGSKTSSSEDFLKAISPKIALISCGVRNKFGHPNGEVLERLERWSNYIYRTDEDGQISLKIYPNGEIKVRTCI